ncbi:MAG: undecaprenyl-phosphate 4-deoxy-4-formamido-L-arabinose transferase [Actinomycetota bacterium]
MSSPDDGNSQASRLLPPGVSIVVPVYRGRDTIADLHRQLAGQLEASGFEWELVFVDDASPDHSWNLIKELAALDPRVRGIQMSRNYGQHAALLAGIRAARFDTTVTMDDDLQHRPDQIPLLLAALDDDMDLVYGQPVEEEHAPWRNITSRLAKWVLATTIGADQARETSAFRAFRTALREGWSRVTDPYVSIDVLLSWTTTHHCAVMVRMDERTIGESNYTFRKLVRHMINMLTGYSTRPLRAVTWLGFIASAFGFVVLLYVVVQYLVSDATVPGFAFISSLVALLGGMQLFGLGMIGEYLGRVHVRSMDRPTYLVRRTIGAADHDRS